MLSVFFYNKFAVEIPIARGSFAYLRDAVVARSWTSYFATLLDRPPNLLHIHTNVRDGFNSLDPIAVGILAIAAMIAMTSAKGNSYLNWITSSYHCKETKDPTKDIPLGLLGSMSIDAEIRCLMTLSLSMMQKYTDVDPNAAYSIGLQSVGMKWAKYLVTLGAQRGIGIVLLVRTLRQMPRTTHIARAHHDSTMVFPLSGTPIHELAMVFSLI
ncbi:hypothetical protein CDL12_08904 [Handroanthus impetiginosus]|uniref:Uncharacterized protein n=1 Tax=Handroanthus impetiginosus TaxID=429701 RepID=A0A2G9HM95_9LAMI|nr:hypothetical protein CDL12_08904 [Handroanthus impetiginosus]